MKKTPMLLQLVVIVLMSAAASYAFQHTVTTYQINGLCFYRYLVYAITVFLGYICFSRLQKFVALTFSFVLSALALSPFGQKAIELFPSFVPFLAVLMGVTTVLVVSRARGRGFSEFVVVLVLPAILAESRIGGSFRLLATVESTGFFELAVIAVIVVGGYFYLRYATSANLVSLELLSNGGNEIDVAKATSRCNLTTTLVVLIASAMAAVLMTTGLIVADGLRGTVVVTPLYGLTLALGASIAIAMILYILRNSHKVSETG